MLTEGTDIDPKVVSYLERVRELLKNIRPEIPKELPFHHSPTIKVIYLLEDFETQVNVVIEPRYLKFLGLEVPEWLRKLLK